MDKLSKREQELLKQQQQQGQNQGITAEGNTGGAPVGATGARQVGDQTEGGFYANWPEGEQGPARITPEEDVLEGNVET